MAHSVMNISSHSDDAMERYSAQQRHIHSTRCERRGAMAMNSGIWVRNVASLQNDATRTNIKDRIAIEPVPSSPPRKRALEEIQVGATILHEGTGDMAHLSVRWTPPVDCMIPYLSEGSAEAFKF
jgi:hypothetical protein